MNSRKALGRKDSIIRLKSSNEAKQDRDIGVNLSTNRDRHVWVSATCRRCDKISLTGSTGGAHWIKITFFTLKMGSQGSVQDVRHGVLV